MSSFVFKSSSGSFYFGSSLVFWSIRLLSLVIGFIIKVWNGNYIIIYVLLYEIEKISIYVLFGIKFGMLIFVLYYITGFFCMVLFLLYFCGVILNILN